MRTSSDDANVWMRAINAELGFVPVESEVIVQQATPAPGAPETPPVADLIGTSCS